MKKFYFKITTISGNEGLGYCIYPTKGYLSKGEQGHGSYVSLTAKDEEDLFLKLKNQDFSTLVIENDPVGE